MCMVHPRLWSMSCTTGVRTLCILFDARVLTLNCFRSISIEGNGAGTVTLKRELSAMKLELGGGTPAVRREVDDL